MRWKYVTVFESRKARHPNEHRTMQQYENFKSFRLYTVAEFTPLQCSLMFDVT